MTREDVVRMAREAGDDVEHTLPSDLDFLERFAHKVIERFLGTMGQYVTNDASREAAIQAAVEAEREACAEIAASTVCDEHLPTGIKIYGTRAAKAIRARGET